MSAQHPIRLRHPSSMYFGKIISRADFVKSASGTKVIALIDNWIAQGMQMLIAEPGWKMQYDIAGSVDFLFISTHKKHVICGSLIPSADTSSRRFPFIAATLFEVDHALDFLGLSPFTLESHVNHQRALVQHAAKTNDAAQTLATLNAMVLETEFDRVAISACYRHFLAETSVAGLENALGIAVDGATTRQMILAIGHLLLPMLSNHTLPPQKALSLPLPRNPAMLSFVKALWLDLICTFLRRVEFEVGVFSCVHFGRPKLLVAFNGVTPMMFRALFDESAAQQHLIDLCDAAWVEDHVRQDAATLKLSSYLQHDELSLRQLLETFRQAFHR